MATRKGFKNLGVDLKDPARCDLSYVYKVATAAVERRDGSGSLRACKDFARKCFKSASKRDTALGAIMSMIPSDAYGSVISGGVMTILAIADEHEKKRQAVETALADIPKKLNKIQRLWALHIKSKCLHEKADGVLVAIFVVLEAIINDLTMDFTTKVKSRMKFGAEDEVNNALASLDDGISQFQEELDVCTQRRMGRMHEGIQRVEDIAKRIATTLDEGNSKAVTGANLEEILSNTLHRFFASNPHFDPVNGGVQHLGAPSTIQSAEESAIKMGESNDTAALSKRNNKVVATWNKSIGGFNTSSDIHLKACIRAGLGQLTSDDREKSEWILSSPEVRDWMRLDESSFLNIRGENAPQGLFHPLSFTAALIAETLQKSTDYPVLSFFCGLRTNDTFDDLYCGPMAVMKGLNGQLINFCLQKRPEVDLSLVELQRKRLVQRSTDKYKYALQLFRGLLGLLEEKDVVFVILDSWSRLLGDRTQADKIIEKLCQTIKDLPDLVIKVLVLDALPSDAVNELAHSSLYVPEEIDSWRNDVHLSRLEQSNARMIEELRQRQQNKLEALDESDVESSDGDW
ncbi:hypothetical protein LX36DRAFT_589633 [Colletotrichum falcatum]|nr:hypothetical protein LX36DRAFT_589633 [Colletotrichum falcatum]